MRPSTRWSQLRAGPSRPAKSWNGAIRGSGENTFRCEAASLSAGVINATASLLLISASFQGPYDPATGLHASLVPPLADWLGAALGPCLRASSPLLCRCRIVRNGEKLHAKHERQEQFRKQNVP